MSFAASGSATAFVRGGAWSSFALCLAALAAVAVVLRDAFDLGVLYVPAAVGIFAAGAAGVLAAAPRDLRLRFGAANQVTLWRGAMLALVASLLSDRPAADTAWLAVTVATAALILDGVDGRLARRRGTASAFGARFDMETDAAAVLVLAALVWHFDKAGPWILVSGLLRYAFVAAAAAAPWLRRELPSSRRRKTVCVVQIAALLFCLAPIVPPGISAPVAAASLGALLASFAVDIAWLAGRRAEAAGGSGEPDVAEQRDG